MPPSLRPLRDWLRTVRFACQIHHSRLRLGDDVIAWALAIWPGLSVSRYRRVDEPRVDGRQRLVIEAERRDHAGPVILDEDVARARDPLQRVASFRRFEVDDGAALPAVDGVEARGIAADRAWHHARRVPRGRLDLDHVSTEIGEHHRAVRARHHLRDVEDAKTVERAAGCHLTRNSNAHDLRDRRTDRDADLQSP